MSDMVGRLGGCRGVVAYAADIIPFAASTVVRIPGVGKWYEYYDDAYHSIAIVRYFEVLGATPVLECHEANFETGDGYRV